MSSPEWIPGVGEDTNPSGGGGGGGAALIPVAAAIQGISVGGAVALVICCFIALGVGVLYVRWVFRWLNDLFSRNEPPQPPHLESKSIELLPTFAYRRGAVAAECSICLGAMSDGEVMRKLPGCGHFFHRDCIDVWLGSRATCPICRENLLKPEGDDAAARSSAAAPPPPLAMLGLFPV